MQQQSKDTFIRPEIPFSAKAVLSLLEKGESVLMPDPSAENVSPPTSEWLSRLQEAGDLAELWIKSDGKKAPYAAWAFIYDWVPACKEIWLLAVNIQLERGKAKLFHQDGKLSEAGLRQVLEAGDRALQDALQSIQQALSQLESSPAPASARRKIARWCRQVSPWPIYREQFFAIGEQQLRIEGEHSTLLRIVAIFAEIGSLVVAVSKDCMEELNALMAILSEAEAYATRILESEKKAGLGKIASKLKDLEQEIVLDQNLVSFKDQLDELYGQLPKAQEWVVEYNQGTLLTLPISIRDTVSQWIRSEVFPYIFEIRELTDSLLQDGRLTLLNMRNWASLNVDRKPDSEPDQPLLDMPSFLHAIEQKVESGHADIGAWSGTIEERMKAGFLVSDLLNDRAQFLAVEGQTGIRHLKINRYRAVMWFEERWRRLAKRYRDFFQMLEREESLTSSEKIVRFLRERRSDPENHPYSSIFRTRGFVSSSFAVGQERHMEHANQIVRDWEAGYRGSLLITGKRFAGKTHFAEFLAMQLFHHNDYRLLPDSQMTVEGRKFATTCQLGPALEEVRRSLKGKRALLLIDDIEGWWDSQITVQENLSDLMKFMAQNGHRIFVVVTMGNSMRAHLEKILDLDQAFQGEVNLDYTSYEQIHEAILIRHGATHRKLVGENGEEIGPQAFRKLTKGIYQAAGGNMGEALNLWAAYTYRQDSDTVISKFTKGHELPDFLDFDTGILLGTILMQRQTNEFRLRKTFGPSFSRKYLPVVRRLIGIGMLARDLGGGLEVDPMVVNKVGELLQEGKYIRYEA